LDFLIDLPNVVFGGLRHSAAVVGHAVELLDPENAEEQEDEAEEEHHVGEVGQGLDQRTYLSPQTRDRVD